MTLRCRQSLRAVLGVLLAALVLPLAVGSAVADRDVRPPGLISRDYDARIAFNADFRATPLPGQGEALRDLARSVVDLAVEQDQATGAVRTLWSRTGYLSLPSAAEPSELATTFVIENSLALGLGAEGLEYGPVERAASEASGTTRVVLQQRHAGLAVYGARIQVNVNGEGRVLSVNNSFLPGLESTVETPEPRIALVAAARAAAAFSTDLQGAAPAEGQLVWLPVRQGMVRLVWSFQLRSATGRKYDFTVDAVRGKVWTRFERAGAAAAVCPGQAQLEIALAGVWRQAMSQVAARLNANWGTALTSQDPGGNAGNERLLLYAAEGRLNAGCAQTITALRDGLIQAAIDNHGGEDVCRMWEAFAASGLGTNAAPGRAGSELPALCGGGLSSGGDDASAGAAHRSAPAPKPLDLVLLAETNLSLGKTVTASGSQGGFPPSNAIDGDVNTYWESTNNAFPQSITIDLGSTTSISRVELKLPVAWPTRTQTLSIQGSTTSATTGFTTIVGSATYTFTSGTNVVTITLPGGSQTRYLRVNVTANNTWPAAQFSEVEVWGTAPAGTNLSLGRTITASSAQAGFPATNANNGNATSYWESANNAFPQWLQVDLGAPTNINRIVLRLPPAWGARTQTLSVQGSLTSATTGFTTLVASASYPFNPASANTVEIQFGSVSTRYVRLNITANSGWPAGQVSEFEIYGVQANVATLSANPSSVAFGNQTTNTSATRTVTITNTGTAAATVSGVTITGAGFSQTNNCTSLAAGASCTVTVTFRPTALGTVNGTLTITSNASNPSLAVPASGTGVAPGTATLSASPTSVAFGNQTTNTSATRTVTVTNTGTASGTVSGVTITGTNANQFSQTNNCATLAAGASCTVNVTFTPTTLGAKSATLTIASNATNPSLTVALTGNGTTVTEPPSDWSRTATMTSSAIVGGFPATNANDGTPGTVTTYWESAGFSSPEIPAAWLNARLTQDVQVSQVIVRLNPNPVWATRTQTFAIEGRALSAGATGPYVTLVASAPYTFNPAAAPTGNTNTVMVNVPAAAAVADLRLRFTANTGAGGGQVADLQILGVAGPNPDLTITGVSATPANPTEATPVTVNATVSNIGTLATPAATNATAYCGTTRVGSEASVPVLQAGASTTVTINAGNLPQGSCAVVARVDDPSTITERNETNNSANGPTLNVLQAPGPDLQVVGIVTNPATPAVGAAVSFTVSVNNRGTDGAPAGSTTRVAVGTTTLNNSNSSAIAAGATVTVVIPGTWTATNGGAAITATADATNVIVETNETNNSFSRTIVVGRGAAVPWVEYEAEAANFQGTLVTADARRTFGHTNFGTESSGRQSVRLTSTGHFVEFTSTNPANSIVVRNSIPDAPGGGGIEATISLYVTPPGGIMTFLQKITFSSRHSWLYGLTDDTEGLSNSPSADARRLFDESNALFAQTFPAGTRFRLQKDATDAAAFYYIDFIDLESVPPPLTKPAECVSITSAPYNATPNDNTDDTAAIQRAVMDDQNGVIPCVWIPPGRFRQEQKILRPDPTRGQFNQLGIRDAAIRGAGMWHSILFTTTEPQNVVGNINHPHEGNVGFEIENNVQISDLAIFGLTTNRANRGHGLNGRFGQNTRITNVWIEHVNVGSWVGRDFSDTPAYWNPAIGLEFSGVRYRNLYADGVNFANGSRNSTVFNSSFRNTGDDSLAVWASTFVRDVSVDIGSNNRFANNTIQLPWRANGIAIYGGFGNVIENNLIYDTMTFPGIMLATDHSPINFTGTTTIANNALYRCGGVFFGEAQRYGAITLFAPQGSIPGVTIRDTEIFDSTYDGIQFKSGGNPYPNVQITNVRIDGTSNTGAGILAQGSAGGNAVLTNVTITNTAAAAVGRNPGSQFGFSGTVNGAPVQVGVVPGF